MQQTHFTASRPIRIWKIAAVQLCALLLSTATLSTAPAQVRPHPFPPPLHLARLRLPLLTPRPLAIRSLFQRRHHGPGGGCLRLTTPSAGAAHTSAWEPRLVVRCGVSRRCHHLSLHRTYALGRTGAPLRSFWPSSVRWNARMTRMRRPYSPYLRIHAHPQQDGFIKLQLVPRNLVYRNCFLTYFPLQFAPLTQVIFFQVVNSQRCNVCHVTLIPMTFIR
jgi:hypothetical protein